MREVIIIKQRLFLFHEIFFQQDLTRNEKIQQARRILNENKYSLDAWAILIQDAQVSHSNKMSLFAFGVCVFRRRKSWNQENSTNH